jgi:hypothetical protein
MAKYNIEEEEYQKELKEYKAWKIGALEREKQNQIKSARATLRKYGKLK